MTDASCSGDRKKRSGVRGSLPSRTRVETRVITPRQPAVSTARINKSISLNRKGGFTSWCPPCFRFQTRKRALLIYKYNVSKEWLLNTTVYYRYSTLPFNAPICLLLSSISHIDYVPTARWCEKIDDLSPRKKHKSRVSSRLSR